MANMAIIEIEGLTKDFQIGFLRKRPLRALHGLNLAVEKGEVFGFLGPNGAGKTTTLKILLNLIRPTAGEARILGEPVTSTSLHRKIGYLPENPYFYDYLTPEELLVFIGKLFGMRQPALGAKVSGLLEMVGLQDARRQQLRKFSKGMVQRIGLAQAMINDPEVIFLDEPMSGLDPLGRREVRRAILALKQNGTTVFFSSHILPDVEALCDRVAIMNGGNLQQVGALHEILKMKIEAHEIVLAGIRAVDAGLRPICEEIIPMGDRLQLRANSQQQVESILSYALAQGASLVSVNPVRPSLEDYFFSQVATGKQRIQESEAGNPKKRSAGSAL
jgi:ABC-2 type transport system ATP-binding protein